MKYSIGDILRIDTPEARAECNGHIGMLSSITRCYFKVIEIKNGKYLLYRMYFPSVKPVERHNTQGNLWCDINTVETLMYKYDGSLEFKFE